VSKQKANLPNINYIVGYTIGSKITTKLGEKDIKLNNENFSTGLNDGLSGKTAQLNEDQIKAKFKAFENKPQQQSSKTQQSIVADVMDNIDMSYIIGYTVGKNVAHDFKAKGIELNQKDFKSGINEAIAGKPSKYTKKQMQEKFKTLEN